MPIIKSAKKRVKTTRKATARNAKTKRTLKTAVKEFHKSLDGDKKKVIATQARAQSELGKAGKKHVMHKNKVARKQSQLAKAAKTAGVTVGATPKKVTTTTSKKPIAKKPPAKKTTTKKS
ncbi:MAG TPA: 30S ribosomal protein S20 [Candidatus Saccharimonadales bacterium]|nr:30S ribosomal protein S20 [Candidatus Saccharimonadales bacterium]